MSEIRAATVSDLAGTGPVTLTGQYAAKAWVNFNGTGTVAIRGSGNVSSITDNGTGDYTVNFTTAMPDANYAVSGITTVNRRLQLQSTTLAATQTTTDVKIRTTNEVTTPLDNEVVSVAIIR